MDLFSIANILDDFSAGFEILNFVFLFVQDDQFIIAIQKTCKWNSEYFGELRILNIVAQFVYDLEAHILPFLSHCLLYLREKLFDWIIASKILYDQNDARCIPKDPFDEIFKDICLNIFFPLRISHRNIFSSSDFIFPKSAGSFGWIWSVLFR